ncbi:hypothetical protein ACWC09_46925 [Streptomyces sp. NPDC001617]
MLAEELAKQSREVQAEREELLVAERVLNRPAEQDRAEAEAAVVAAPPPAQVAGRPVLLIPHHGEGHVSVMTDAEWQVLPRRRGVEGTLRGLWIGLSARTVLECGT